MSLGSIEQIVDLQLALAGRRLDAWGMQVRLGPAARRSLAQRAHHPEYGVRPLRRLIEREVLDPVARVLLSGGDVSDLPAGVVVVDVGAHDSPTGPEQTWQSEAPGQQA
ncbi:MAG: hypothetical protein M3419_07985 [Actinomycetota bacterium]|nr:hypothetical protein [Actinomycetota bacterium]